eukprot:GHVU01094922.1.p1 GENE.GHVU01094922.1~~GHVU01094922.1.p1  ORF type:complete len:181 (+),score=22.76 GHVU01094922.1:42-545(+)
MTDLVIVPERRTVTMVPLRSKSSSNMVRNLQQVLRQAEQDAVRDLRDEEREFRLQERVHRAEAERDKALKELAELRKERENRQVDSKAVTESKRAMVGLVEALMVKGAAEALRRRETGKLLIGVAASDQVYRSTTSRNQGSCRCHTTAQAALAAGTTLPGTSDSRAC